MAKNKVEIDVKADDNGSLKKMSINSKTAGKGLDDVAKNSRNADRNIKGVAASSSNATKNFSKMAQGTGGIVGAYATLAANIFAISAAFNFLKSAGDLAALQRGQEAYAMKTGQNLKMLTDNIQDATGGILDFSTAAQAAAIGRAAGISADQLTGLAKIAKNASVTLGRDLTDSFNRLTRGAIKAEPELLDELGIVLRLEKASNDYAMALNKNADELTTFEKSQAVVNAVLEQGNRKFDDVGDNVNQVARLGKAFDDLIIDIKEGIEPIATFVSGVLADNVKALTAAFGILGLSITRSLAPAAPQLSNLSTMAESSRAALMGAAGTGKVGKKVAGGDFSKANLSAIERGAGATTGSTVVNQQKMSQAAFKKHVAIIRADHALMVAENTRGIGKYYASFKANLLAMEVEHGKTMGRIKMAGAVMASGLSKVLNAVAIIGMISLAITMIKEFIEYFKDPALKRMNDNAEKLSKTYQEQASNLKDMVTGFKDADSAAANVVKRANLLSNFVFPADEIDKLVGGFRDAEMVKTSKMVVNRMGQATQVEGDDVISKTLTEEQGKAIQANINLLEVQQDALNKVGVESELVDKQTANLTEAQNLLNKVFGEDAVEGSEEYNKTLASLTVLLPHINKDGRVLSTVLNPGSAAITGITEIREKFQAFQTDLKQAPSKYDTVIGMNKQFGDSFQQMIKDGEGATKLGDFFVGEDDTTISTLKSMLALGKDGLVILDKDTKIAAENLTMAQAKEALEARSAVLRDRDLEVSTKMLKKEKTLTENLRTKQKFEHETLQTQHKVDTVANSITRKENDILTLKEQGVKKSDTAMVLAQAELDLLEEQKTTAEKLRDIAKATQEERKEINIQKEKQQELNFEKAILDIKQKALDIKKQELDLIEKASKRQIDREMRDYDRSTAFSFIDSDRVRAKKEASAFFGTNDDGSMGDFNFTKNKETGERELKAANQIEGSLLQKKLQFLETEKVQKDAMIRMEYDLLEAKTRMLAEEVRVAAEKMRQSNDPEGEKKAGNLEDLAGRIDKQVVNMGEMRASALALNESTYASQVEDVIDFGTKLKDTIDDLTDINKIKDKIAEGFASEMTGAFTAIVDGSKSAKDAFKDMGAAMLDMITKLVMEMIVLSTLKSFMPGLFKDGGISKDPIKSAYGGVYSKGRDVTSMAPGGIARGPRSGYPAILHGTEAVVPLPKGRSIPVEMSGGGGQVNNINISVSVDKDGNESTDTDGTREGEGFAKAISAAVQQELHKQKRHGGMLSPFGVA